jgi:hypothetical protein
MPEQTAAPDAETTEPAGGQGWGRLLDLAGIAAGILLIVIVADIVSDGRLISRRLRKPQDGEASDRPAD